MLVGVIGGFVVGITSVGSGSLIIIALMALYPGLKASELVGTDLVQAVPLVASAALGHLLFGDFQMALTVALLVGCIPGVWIGAQLSSRAPGGLIRRALAFVLLASALKLLGVPTVDDRPDPARRLLLVAPPPGCWSGAVMAFRRLRAAGRTSDSRRAAVTIPMSVAGGAAGCDIKSPHAGPIAMTTANGHTRERFDTGSGPVARSAQDVINGTGS